jgi:dihydrolipoamide dehydrogenase
MVELMPRPLSTEDQDMSDLIERELKKVKIKLITKAKVERIERDAGGVVATLSNGTAATTEKILVSIGRSLNTESLGLAAAGVQLGGRGGIAVNEKMETNVPGIYAVGDVTGKMMLAHVASHQGLVAVENALGGNAVMDYGVIPAGIFTMPEVGSVGLREHEAAGKGISVKIGRFPYRGLGKAHAMGEITGLAKVIADGKTDRVLGVHICGAHATDVIHEAALAIKLGATARELGRMVHAHPTLAEALMEASEDVHGAAIHIPKPAKQSSQSP